MSLTHTPLGLMDKKKGAQEWRKKKGKTMHFDHSCTAFLCLLSVWGNWFYGIHNLQWRWTLKRTLEWYWGCCQEKSERLSSDIFILFSPLPLFLHHSFFPAHGGKMLILSEEYLEFCLPQWLCFATGAGYCPYIYMAIHCEFDLHGRSDFMLVCVYVCIL